MKSTPIHAALLFAAAFAPQIANGQASITTKPGTESVTLTEPGRIKLADLFKMADVVAVVHIVSGDTESYDSAVYKAVVVTSFKGTVAGKTLFFGPFVGSKLGSEYVAFLRKSKSPAVPTRNPTASYGTVEYLEVFNQGYSQMESSYECGFNPNSVDQACDYGVKVCTDYITLPKGVPAFTPESNDPPFGCRWVRKSKFMSLLSELAEKPGVLQLP